MAVAVATCAIVGSLLVGDSVTSSLAKKGLGQQNLMRTPEQLQTLTQDVHPLKAFRGVATSRLMRRLEVLDYYQHPAGYLSDIPTVKRVVITMSQHIGRPAEPIVQVGQMIEKGEMIAKPAADSLSVAMHASISGRVVSVAENITIERVNNL